MDDRHSLLDTVANVFVPIHRDGYKFVFAGAVLTLFLFMIATPLGWLAALATAWCAYFFRDPDRITPLRPGLVVSGADGKVASIAEGVVAPRELGLGTQTFTRISVFLTIFDVHIARAPVAGRVIRSTYVPGAFVNAELDKASEENERRALVIETEDGAKVGVMLIAGLVARRIVTFVSEGASLNRGERIGLIRFGSRVDVYVPDGTDVLAEIGQTAIGGETVVAEFASDGKADAGRPQVLSDVEEE